MVLEQVVFSGFFFDELVAKIWVRIGLSFFCLCVRNNNGRLNIWFFYESRRFAIARLTTTPDLLKPSLVYHFNSAAHGYWFFFVHVDYDTTPALVLTLTARTGTLQVLITLSAVGGLQCNIFPSLGYYSRSSFHIVLFILLLFPSGCPCFSPSVICLLLSIKS